MANSSISRRAVLPAVVAGATAVALTDAGAADRRTRRYAAQAGPAGFTRGQSLITAFFLPAVQSTANLPAVQFQLTLFTLDGQLIGTSEFQVQPGRGAASTLQGFADGSVRLDGKPVNVTLDAGQQVHVYGILIGLLLPAVQTPAATLQCANNVPLADQVGAGLGPTTYVIPFLPAVQFTGGV